MSSKFFVGQSNKGTLYIHMHKPIAKQNKSYNKNIITKLSSRSNSVVLYVPTDTHSYGQKSTSEYVQCIWKHVYHTLQWPQNYIILCNNYCVFKVHLVYHHSISLLLLFSSSTCLIKHVSKVQPKIILNKRK